MGIVVGPEMVIGWPGGGVINEGPPGGKPPNELTIDPIELGGGGGGFEIIGKGGLPVGVLSSWRIPLSVGLVGGAGSVGV